MTNAALRHATNGTDGSKRSGCPSAGLAARGLGVRQRLAEARRELRDGGLDADGVHLRRDEDLRESLGLRSADVSDAHQHAGAEVLFAEALRVHADAGADGPQADEQLD